MKLCAKLPNGIEIEAPLEKWVAALIGVLPEKEREALFVRMRQDFVYRTPGHHILRAEGMRLGLKG